MKRHCTFGINYQDPLSSISTILDVYFEVKNKKLFAISRSDWYFPNKWNIVILDKTDLYQIDED